MILTGFMKHSLGGWQLAGIDKELLHQPRALIDYLLGIGIIPELPKSGGRIDEDSVCKEGEGRR
jgi:hypothetical protein